MKLRAQRKDLLSALSRFVGPSKSTIEALLAVKLEVKDGWLMIHSTDLRLYGVSVVAIDENAEPGDVFLPFKRLKDILESLTWSNVDIRTIGGKVEIRSETFSTQMTPLNEGEGFNEMNPEGDGLDRIVPTANLKAAWQLVKPYTKDGLNESVCWLTLGAGRMDLAAIEGSHRAGNFRFREEFQDDANLKVVLPSAFFERLVTVPDELIQLTFRDQNMIAETQSVRISCRYIERATPDVVQVYRNLTHAQWGIEGVFYREELARAIKRSFVCAQSDLASADPRRYIQVWFSKDGEAVLSVQNDYQASTETVPFEVVRVYGRNPKNLKEATDEPVKVSSLWMQEHLAAGISETVNLTFCGGQFFLIQDSIDYPETFGLISLAF